jgi:hypothetical protein
LVQNNFIAISDLLRAGNSSEWNCNDGSTEATDLPP